MINVYNLIKYGNSYNEPFSEFEENIDNFKIDIKSETQAVVQGIYDKFGVEYDKNKYKEILEKKANEEEMANSDAVSEDSSSENQEEV